MFAIRPATARDIVYLHHIDVCCFDNPWEEGTWLRRLHDSEVTVGTYRETVVGFSVGTKGEHIVKVDKVAVQPDSRRNKLATKLLMPIVRTAIAEDSDLLMIVPETHLPDTGLWAKAEGFQTCVNLLRDHFTICGESRDGIAFTYPLSKRHAN